VNSAVLYVKRGCPFCAAARDYLNQHEIAYEQIDVRGDDAQMQKLKQISGQTRTPTLVWDGKVLADFAVNDLEKFLADRRSL
jgi:glutaredoxin 3